MKLLLTGATGVGGLNIYRAALADPSIDRVTLLLRREMPSWAQLPLNAAEKTDTILHSDFMSYPPELASRLAQHDACIWALGVGANGMTEADYTRIINEYPMTMLRTLRDAGVGKDRPADKPFRFVYFSGEMADPSQKSAQMWARVKGRTETDLAAFCAENPGMKAHNIRPAYFGPSREYPEDKKHQRTFGQNILGTAMYHTLRFALPAYLTPTGELNASVLAIAKGKCPDQELFRNTQLRQIAKELGIKE